MKAMAKPQNSTRPQFCEIAPESTILMRSKKAGYRGGVGEDRHVTIDTSMNAEPNIVNRKNLVAAYTLRPWPHRPIRRRAARS
jgi:hypothetical protein